MYERRILYRSMGYTGSGYCAVSVPCEFDMSEWQPIETAPDSSERFLVSYLFHGQRRASQVAIVEKYRGEIILPSRYYEATHWMPLPEPPK